MNNVAVIVHGGAGRITDQYAAHKLPGLTSARDHAWNTLINGGSPEQAVRAALRLLEGDQHFNAGYGGYPNERGIVLLDAGMMRGNGDFVSLINVRQLKYPSEILFDMLTPGRRLMTVWTHELMQQVVTSKDSSLRERYGLVNSHEEMIAPVVRELLASRGTAELRSSGEGSHGTVGCVARDAYGRIAAGTSTGGIYLKHNGRVGDSPVIGSGLYADDAVAGISTSGSGEEILMSNLTGYTLGAWREALDRDTEAFRKTPSLAKELLERELARFHSRSSAAAGMIAIPAGGEPIYGFKAPRFAVATRFVAADGGTREYSHIASGDTNPRASLPEE